MSEYLSVQDVADALGIKPSTVRSYVARKQMPSWNYCPTCGHAPTWARWTLAEWRPEVFGDGAGS
jgi:hypothetical protein